MSKLNPHAISKRGVFRYDPNLTQRAREMRNSPTQAEEKIWRGLLSHRPENLKFIRQKPIGEYILDFYCSKIPLAIEIDGSIHSQNQEYDKKRDNFLAACGIEVIRFKNNDVLKSFDSVKLKILERINFINAISRKRINK